MYRTKNGSNPGGWRLDDASLIALASGLALVRSMLNPYLVFWSIGLLFFAAEWLKPARPIAYRAVFWRDLLALGVYNLSFLIVVQLTDRIPVPQYLPTALDNLPTAGKLVLFYIVEDFGLYWAHRLMHTSLVWPVHRWHHSPTSLYWLAGIRATIPHIALFNVTYVAALPLLHDASGWAFQVIMVEHIVRNNWMHVNVTWKSSWLEWVLVTPRYHHIHHSSDPAHQLKNLGALLTIWDRVFGTYYNPDDLTGELTFGLSERVNPVRLVVGV
ncbi:MAG TPA: sterol desaturase family protein [Nitrospira sp.]|nr:sterol desaturase family protein [Nitrospira sp.]